jgi:large subunit ribosomal protein L11e
MKKKEDNVMRDIKIRSLTINCCVGESGDKLTKALKVIEDLTGQKPCTGKAKYTVRSFGIKRNEEIAVFATIRGEKAEELLKKGLKVKEMELRGHNFSKTGTFGFGIEEHIELGMKYDPTTGIYGMHFIVCLTRAGARVGQRKHCGRKIGNKQKVSKADAIKWFKEKFGGIVYGA